MGPELYGIRKNSKKLELELKSKKRSYKLRYAEEYGNIPLYAELDTWKGIKLNTLSYITNKAIFYHYRGMVQSSFFFGSTWTFRICRSLLFSKVLVLLLRTFDAFQLTRASMNKYIVVSCCLYHLTVFLSFR